MQPSGAAAGARSARARGLRTLQHQSLPAEVCYAIDTEVWYRALLLQRGEAATRERGWATKDQVHDEALGWFLERYAERAGAAGLQTARAGGPTQDLTFWIDSRLLGRVRRLAGRASLRLAQLIELALTEYVRQRVPAELVDFRRRVESDACRLYTRLRGER